MNNNIDAINATADVRKLATSATILDVFPIDGADNIECVKIRGWNVVVKKGEYSIGDKTIYVEVDSVLPDGLPLDKVEELKVLNKRLSKTDDESEKEDIKAQMAEISKLNTRPEFEFLRQTKFRIKTRKILSQISQGICFPLNVLQYVGIDPSTVTEDDIDFTEALGITQWTEPESASLGGNAKGELGSLGILKSDEERIENLAKIYPELKKFRYCVSEKMEGSSVSYVLKNDVFNVCSRSLNLNDSENNTFWKVAHRYDIEEKMRNYAAKHNLTNWSIQGELIGEGIQGNIYKIKGHTALFYNAFNIDTQEYFEYSDFLEMIAEMGFETCPILYDDYELPDTIDELFAIVDEFKTTYGNTKGQIYAEGWVFVAKGNVVGNKIERSAFNRLSFKAKSRTYDMVKKK